MMIKVIKGKIRIRVWARENYLEISDFIVMNPYETYEVEAITEDNQVAFIYFDNEIVSKFSEKNVASIILCNTYYYHMNNPEKYQTLRRSLDKLCSTIELGKSLFEISEEVENPLAYMYKHFDYLKCGVKFDRFSDKIINRYNYLFESLFEIDKTKRNSLKDVCSNLDISYGHMRKDIRERYGFGYKWLRYSLMIKQATIMIATSNYSNAYISDHCGFSDSKYLIQYFKEFYGLTPSTFRARYESSTNKLNGRKLY